MSTGVVQLLGSIVSSFSADLTFFFECQFIRELWHLSSGKKNKKNRRGRKRIRAHRID